MKWCVRCGRWFTPKGREVRHSAAIRGEFSEPTDTICDNCIRPIDNENRNDEHG